MSTKNRRNPFIKEMKASQNNLQLTINQMENLCLQTKNLD